MRRLVARAIVIVLLLAGAWTAIETMQIARAGRAGKAALVRAETSLSDQNVDQARTDVASARRSFDDVHKGMTRLGPLRVIGHQVPLLRIQVRAAEAYDVAGRDLSRAASQLVEAAAGILEPPNDDLTIAQGLGRLRTVKSALDDAVVAIDGSVERTNGLRGKRLIGPLASVMNDFVTRIERVRDRAHSADAGLDALITFIGGDGDRRYLVLSQNTDEPRPTGGYIGTYGVLHATSTHVDLERYASIESWYVPRRQKAVVPVAQAPNAFRIPTTPENQTIANVNATADWPAAAKLAMDLWTKGGEQPVDGVIGITPELLARVVRVLGPVPVPQYNEIVSATNIVDRMDYYTHLNPSHVDDAHRKDFVVQLAQAVVNKMLDAPAGKWEPLARALGNAFTAREGMAWTRDMKVSKQLAVRAWDGVLPDDPGDFFYAGEFAYVAKNGRALRRTFDHTVTLNADGTGRVETRMHIANTSPGSTGGLLNIDSLAYITTYGPFSGVLASGSDKPYAIEPSLSEHPAWGGDRAARPLGEDQLFVAWDVPKLLVRGANGTMVYRLTWMRNIGNRGDIVKLTVHPPAGWRWKGAAPPASISLSADFRGSWLLERSGA